jgi:hypothetical protein
MKYFVSKFNLALMFLLSVGLLACDDDDTDVVKPLEAELVENLAADPTQNPDGSPKTKTNKFTLFSFKDNAVIANTDSATSKWDIGFRSTTIIVNGGVSGPGQAQAQVVSGVFDELTDAPADGYSTDAQGTYAISGWYNYTGQSGTPANAIIPVPGKIIVINTADGRYAKVEILGYYYGNPDTSTAQFADLNTRPAARYYTFRFIYQPDGSPNLEDD